MASEDRCCGTTVIPVLQKTEECVHEQGPQHGDGSEMLAMEGGHDMSGLPEGVATQPVNISVNM